MDIDTILEKWDSAKKEKSKLEKECEMYKKAVERYMNKKEKNIVLGKIYKITRRSNTRQQLSKQNVPKEIWDRYSNRFTYFSYHLKRK